MAPACAPPPPVPSPSPSSPKSALFSHFRVKPCEDPDQGGTWNGQVCVSEQLPAAWRPLWGRPRRDAASRDRGPACVGRGGGCGQQGASSVVGPGNTVRVPGGQDAASRRAGLLVTSGSLFLPQRLAGHLPRLAPGAGRLDEVGAGHKAGLTVPIRLGGPGPARCGAAVGLALARDVRTTLSCWFPGAAGLAPLPLMARPRP